jgi:hypothetical protein
MSLVMEASSRLTREHDIRAQVKVLRERVISRLKNASKQEGRRQAGLPPTLSDEGDHDTRDGMSVAIQTAAATRTNGRLHSASRPPWLRLPAELRNRIHEYALSGRPFWIAYNNGRISQNSRHYRPNPLSLPATCILVRRETLQLAYSLNHFIVQSMSALTRFLNAIGYEQAQSLRKLTFDAGKVYVTTYDPHGSAMLRGVHHELQGVAATLSDCDVTLRFALRHTVWALHGWIDVDLHYNDVEASWEHAFKSVDFELQCSQPHLRYQLEAVRDVLLDIRRRMEGRRRVDSATRV